VFGEKLSKSRSPPLLHLAFEETLSKPKSNVNFEFHLKFPKKSRFQTVLIGVGLSQFQLPDAQALCQSFLPRAHEIGPGCTTILVIETSAIISESPEWRMAGLYVCK
jgi:hypothetical protein